ncbi:MAG TPA: DNA repair protein RecN [Mariniphaga sp.]|nr:DNA repair protein RecN [Mariniphaga sp.]
MLIRLAISNYALISNLDVEFHAGLNTITGETGAGKSIILGALGLILGNRADLSVLKNQNEKCIVEGFFELADYKLEQFFEQNDLDYDNPAILRREISPSGKSRAFINDTPVSLKTLRELGLHLIDIHSQHQNLELGNRKFQLQFVDVVSGAGEVLQEYKLGWSEYVKLQKKLEDLRSENEKEKADLDYWLFQFNQLEEAKLEKSEQDDLEAELEKLTHAEEIKSAFAGVQQLLENDNISLIQNLKSSQKFLEGIQQYVEEVPDIIQRVQSCTLELRDILEESERLAENVDFDAARIDFVNDRLNLIYGLQQKHQVNTVLELIELKNLYSNKIGQVNDHEEQIAEMEALLTAHKTKLDGIANRLTSARKQSFAAIEKAVVNDLSQLGMAKSKIKIIHEPLSDFSPDGKDSVSVLFSANIDTTPSEISKIASGGEMSRLMLAVKNLLRTSKALPTVVFDEIDSGISGEIALRMGNILKEFAATTQIINITHLPQIAAKGDAHFRVYKYEEAGKTYSSVKQLNDEERVEELAKMVGGENLTDTTLKTAAELLKG